MSRRLVDVLVQTPSLHESFKKDPIATMKELETRFSIDLSDVKEEEVTLLSNLSPQEIKTLGDIRAKANAVGLSANNTGNAYY